MTEADEQGEFEQLQDQLDELRDELTSTHKIVDIVADSLIRDREHVKTSIDRLEKAVKALTGEDTPTGNTPKAFVDYATAEEWVALCEWVDWLQATYDLRRGHATVPPCWPAHLGVAEELAALRSSWREAARRARGRDNDALAYWHDRYLQPCLTRLHSFYGIHACKDERHEPVSHPPATDRTLIDVRSATEEEPATV